MKYRTGVAGFTIIEVLVALVIVSVAVLSLGSFTVSTMSTGQVSRERLSAVHLAEQILEYWQHDAQDFAPSISSSCALTPGTTALPGANVVCSPPGSIAYTIALSRSQLTGPLPGFSTFQNFTQYGYSYAPYTKLVTVTWSHSGRSRSIYLTHVSMVK